MVVVKPNSMTKIVKEARKRQRFDVGSIFSIDLDSGKYAFGRCLVKMSIGHLVEIFDYLSETESFNSEQSHKRLFDPIIIDSYSLFLGKRQEGNWHVIEQQKSFVPTEIEHLGFVYGTGNERFLVDAIGNKTIISKVDSERYPFYSPNGNIDVIEMINSAIDLY
jgi:hypothetical protein